jgi:hypothetical protein
MPARAACNGWLTATRWCSPAWCSRRAAWGTGSDAGRRCLPGAGAVVLAVFGWWELRIAEPMLNLNYFKDPRFSTTAASVALLGLGMGMTMAPATDAIMSSLPPAKAGVGSAVNDTIRLVGGSLGVAVLGSVLSSSFKGHLTDHFPHRQL